jgi:hypothetical protein
VLSAGVLAGAAWAPALGQSAPQEGFDKPLKTRAQPGQSSSTVVVRQDDGENSYELRIIDGKTTAKVNGKDVPEDRIVREGGTIKILGKDGQTLTTFKEPTVKQGEGRAPRATRSPRAMRIEPRTPQPPEPPQATEPEHAKPNVMVGIMMDAANEDQLKEADLDEGTEAIVIQSVVPGLPAEKAGIKEGDIITEIDGKKPATQDRLREVLMGKKPGDTVSFTVHRESGDKAIRVRLEKYDADKLPMASTISPDSKAWEEAMKHFPNMPKEWPGGTVVVPGPEGQRWRMFTPGANADERLAELDKRMADLDEKLSKLNDQMAKLEELVEKLSKRGRE